MTCLPVIIRELRAESHRPFNHWLRVIGVGALLAACWFALRTQAIYEASFGSRGFWTPGGMVAGPASSPNLPRVFGSLLFGHANAALFATLWILVPLLTADSVSREKREGTLGLLFLTPLTASGVVIGKSFVHGLRALTLFLTMLPILAVPVLLGGVSASDVGMAILLDACALMLALAAGLLASCMAKETARAVILAEVLSLAFAVIFMGAHQHVFEWAFGGGGFQGLTGPRWAGRGILSMLTELFEFNTNLVNLDRSFAWGGASSSSGPWAAVWASAVPAAARTWFTSVGLLVASSALILVLTVVRAAFWVQRTWREEPPSAQAVELRRTYCEPRIWRGVFRRKMRRALDRNPIAWLQQYSLSARLTKWGWCLFIVLAECALASGWSELAAAQIYLGVVLLSGLAFAAAASFRQERQSGALELLLITPLRVGQLISGRLVGLWMQFLPAGVVLFLCWNFADEYLPHRHVFMLQQETPLGPGLFLSIGLPLPLIGLYFSFTRRSLLNGWLLTCVFGIGVPLLLSSMFFTPLPRSGYELGHLRILLSVAAEQGGLATLAWLLLAWRLRRVVSSGLKP